MHGLGAIGSSGWIAEAIFVPLRENWRILAIVHDMSDEPVLHFNRFTPLARPQVCDRAMERASEQRFRIRSTRGKISVERTLAEYASFLTAS